MLFAQYARYKVLLVHKARRYLFVPSAQPFALSNGSLREQGGNGAYALTVRTHRHVRERMSASFRSIRILCVARGPRGGLPHVVSYTILHLAHELCYCHCIINRQDELGLQVVTCAGQSPTCQSAGHFINRYLSEQFPKKLKRQQFGNFKRIYIFFGNVIVTRVSKT